MTDEPVPKALFSWPVQSRVGRLVPKSKIYAHAKPGAAVRQLFVEQVESMTWLSKLSPETINLPASAEVPEIEVFELALKQPVLDLAVLRSIDKAIPYPLLFVLRFEGRSQPVAAYKRPSEAASSQWVLGDYHSGRWERDELAQPGLPMALNLQGLYEQLLRRHLALPARPGEALQAQLERLALLGARRKAASALESRLAQEIQYNRKVEVNAQLRSLRQDIARLAAHDVQA